MVYGKRQVLLTPLMHRRLFRWGWSQDDLIDRATSIANERRVEAYEVPLGRGRPGWRFYARKYVHAYVLFDILAKYGNTPFPLKDPEKYVMANIFEDLCQHLLKTILAYWDYLDREVVFVDRTWSQHFRGLDLVVLHDRGWRVGVQCKRSVHADYARRDLKRDPRYVRLTTRELCRRGAELRSRHKGKTLALFTYNLWVDPKNPEQNRRVRNLRRAWDFVVWLEDETWEDAVYRPTLEHLVRFANDFWRR